MQNALDTGKSVQGDPLKTGFAKVKLYVFCFFAICQNRMSKKRGKVD